MTHRWEGTETTGRGSSRETIARRGTRPSAHNAPRGTSALALSLALLAQTGCATNDDSGAPAAADGSADVADASPPDAPSEDGSAPAPPLDAGTAGASVATAAIDFGEAGCGADPVTQTFTVTSNGQAALTVSATTTGSAFSVTPTSLSVPDGGTATFTVSATVDGTATAGTPLTGSLNLFTNDPHNTSIAIPLSVTPSGAMLALPPGQILPVSFATSEVGIPAAPAPFQVTNVGNAAGTFTFAAPVPALFSVPLAATEYTIDPGGTLSLTAQFTPGSAALVTATSAIAASATTALCGKSLSAISFTGQGATGEITGYPTAPIDFGPAPCGGAAPAARSFTLTNTGTVTAHIIEASLTGAPGFTTTAAKGRYILPNGVLAIQITPPAVPSSASFVPITGTLTIQTDADAAPQTIALSEEPSGAVLAFQTASTAGFGDFGSVVLLGSASQTFGVSNTGNAPADVTLSVTSLVPDGGAQLPFTLPADQVSLAAGATESEAVVFAPTSALPASAGLSLVTTSPVCSALPAPVPLSGVGIGGGPVVSATSLVFGATCGGPAPAAQSFSIQNLGSANLTWAMSPVTGAGAAQYQVIAGTPPGLLLPGASAILTVSASAIASPAPSNDPAAFAAALTITTDVPLDPPHVISLGETPLGDQLSISLSSLRFGQAPIGSSLSQSFTVTNVANAGSPAASFALAVQGTGASGYSVVPSSETNVASAGGTSAPMEVVFAPGSAVPYPAAVSVTTSDPVCTALPAPIALTGTGTQGEVSISTTSLTFGSDASDPLGFVNCGATGLPHSFSVTNVGNQALHVTELSLGQGSASPYVISGPALPALLPIGGGATFTVTPKAIPSSVPDPNDPSVFTDTLTLITDAALDVPHPIALVMQARGAIIQSTPLPTTWNFGTIGFGSIGTISTTITNAGNAPATVSLDGLREPSVFGIRNDPTAVASNGTTAIVGQFVPPSSDGAWADQGTLTVAADALCAPVPASWDHPSVALSGTSNGSPAITTSGSLVFPTTDCGAGPPAGQSVVLTNTTNVPYAYALSLQSGTFYTLEDSGTGVLPARGAATVLVTPKKVVPGPGVRPGAAPYQDDLLISVATTPASRLVVPISWALDGAVLSLPLSAGPDSDALGAPFYPADSTGALTLPLQNTGTASANVTFAIEPAGAVVSSPATPIAILPGIAAAPGLVSTAAAAACPATTSSTLTFFYTGPVCQPFALASVNVRACAGAFP